MLLKSLSVFLLMPLALLSCREEESLTFTNHNVVSPETSVVRVAFPKAKKKGQLSKTINKNINEKVITILCAGETDNYPDTVEESIKRFDAEYASFKEEFPDAPAGWEADVRGEVSYQTPEFVCIGYTSYLFMGGAHGIQTKTFQNLDVATGQPLENDELFNDIESFKTLAEGIFKAQIKGREHLYFDGENSFVLPASIGFNNEGVVLFYNPYEIAPYATGTTEFVVPYEACGKYLRFGGDV